MTTQETIYYLIFIRNAYKNLNENPPEEFRIIGKSVNAIVEYNKPSYSEYVEALDLAISALKKQIPKKPLEDTINRGSDVSGEYDIESNYICPNCGEVVGDYENAELWDDFCNKCGQALSIEETQSFNR